jgi:hypothetical protein
LHTMRYSFEAKNNDTWAETTWTGKFQATWNSIFSAVAPLMINEISDYALKLALDGLTKELNTSQLRKRRDLKDNDLSNFHMHNDDFQTIKVQLRALGLMVMSNKARSVKDVTTYWTLTPYGDDVMTRLRAIKKVAVAEQDPEVEKKSS